MLGGLAHRLQCSIPPVLVFGTICIDRLRQVSRLPSAGGYVEVEDEQWLLGGEAANTANALVSWGNEVILAGNSLGVGSEARRLLRMIQDHRLPTEWLGLESLSAEQPTTRTPVCDIFVTPDGERTMFGIGFASAVVGIDLEFLPFQPRQWFTAEPNLRPFARQAIRLAEKAGAQTYLMDFVLDDDPIPQGCFWQSSTDWAGHRNNMQRNVRWVKEWVDRHGCFTVLSDGPNGFVAGSPELPVRPYPPYPAPSVVDTTGAGDAFRAGMLHGLSHGWPIPRCLQFAASAGCLSCAYLGATTTVPSIQAIEANIAANPDVSRQFL